MRIESHTDIQCDLTDEQLERLYLIHHMHHFKGDQGIYHELHHCFLYERTDMKGNKHQVLHSEKDDSIQHVLDTDYTGTLFNHDNNEFSVTHGIIAL